MKISLILLLVILTGCAVTLPTGHLYKDTIKELPKIEPNKSRLIVFRHTEDKGLRRADAHIKIDSISKEAIVYGGFSNIDILAGKHTMSVNAFGTSACELDFTVVSGEKLFFEIKPRKEKMSSAWFMFGALGAVVASAVESAGKKCGGEFIIQKVSKKYATNKLATLRKNK
ncbi:hypothetical protein [uncultured Gammaproteobacteria bacterium]|jgi:hypothetical protein|nr:hypothetical protein [uncultured Gammaproteobacteria bacterium]